jgi:4-amino-4-deoxy-L-arabinose transferase-like glycosyltransferase
MLKIDSPKKKEKWIFLIVLAAIVLRSPAFFNPIIDGDEAHYAVAAQVMNDGGLIYKHAVDLKPPLLFYFYSFWFSIFGDDLRVLHLVTAFWVLATALAIGGIARQLSGRWEAAYLSALLYVLFTPTFVPQALSTNGEIIMNLPLALSGFFFLKSEQRPGLAFLGGFFCSAAFLVKYQSGILLAVFGFYILAIKPFVSQKRPEKSALAQSLLAFAGFAGVLFILHAAFLYLGNWEDFYFWGWQYNFTFMSGLTWPHFFKRFFGMTPRFILVWFILWFFAFAAIKKAIRLPREIHAGYHFAIVWLAGSALAVCAGGKFFGHYYIQLLPPLAILAAGFMFEWWRESGTRRFAKWRRGIVFAGIVAPPLIYLGTNWQEELKRMEQVNRFLQQIAAEVQQLTSEEDRVFIWGKMHEVYYFSRRLPGSRFVTCDFIAGMNAYNYNDETARMGDIEGSPIAAQLFDDLHNNRPKLVINTSPLNFRQYGIYPVSDFPRLHDFINRNYRLAKTIGPLEIYEFK